MDTTHTGSRPLAVAGVRILGKTDWVQLHRASTVPANRAQIKRAIR